MGIKLGILEYKEIQKVDKKQYLFKAIIGTGLYLFDNTILFDRKKKVNQFLLELYGKVEYSRKYRLYIAQKTSGIYLVGYLIVILVTVISYNNNQIESISSIARPEYGEGSKSESISYELISGNNRLSKNILIEINEKNPTKEQMLNILDNVANDLEDNILNDNESLNHVTTHLNLYDEDKKYNVKIKWFSNDENIMLNSGYVLYENIKSSHEVILTAVLRLDDLDKIIEIPIAIYPRNMTLKEEFNEVVMEIDNFVKDEMNEINDENIILPITSRKNIKVKWFNKEKVISTATVLIMGTFFTILLFLVYDLSLKNLVNKRREEIINEFPSFINKMVLLINGGMTFKGAWLKVSDDYTKYKKRRGKKIALYEEMIITNKNINNGMSNIEAYQEFGRRCHVSVVKRFSINVTQNLVKGGNQLVEVLKEQRKESFDNRKNEARIAGEKASTKLLLPMSLMLIGIMLIVMTPIMMSFSL